MAKKLSKPELRKYVEEQILEGYSDEEITEHLMKHGYKEKDLNEIFADMLEEKVAEKKKITARVLEVLFAAGFLGVLFFTGIFSGAEAGKLLFGFSPLFVNTIFLIVMMELNRESNRLVWVLPAFVVVVVYAIGISLPEFTHTMELVNISLLNIVLSYAFVIIMYALVAEKHEVTYEEEKKEHKEEYIEIKPEEK